MDKEAIEEMIRHDNECVYMDFKAIEYTKEKYPNLLKDIMSMANAHYPHDKFIITGVKHKSDNTRDFLGIDTLTDSASIQQLVNENIEPDLNISYDPITIDNKLLGVLKISGCSNRPYLMKKNFNPLRTGDGFIRKGSFTKPITRSDYDKIYASKNEEVDFQDKVIIKSIDGCENKVFFNITGNLKSPIDFKKEKIQEEIANKKMREKMLTSLGMQPINIIGNYATTSFFTQKKTYEEYSLNELERMLEEVDKEYNDDSDYSYAFHYSNLFNLIITNTSDQYIENAIIKVFIPKIDGILVFTNAPRYDFDKFQINLHYPQVNIDDSFFCIENDISDIKHGLDINAFWEDVRIAISSNISVSEFEIECRIYAKNIKEFISKKIKVYIKQED